MNKEKKRIIIGLAQQAEDKRKQGLRGEQAVHWFVEQLKDNRIPAKGWFTLDDAIRRASSMEEWFWVIRSVRNNMGRYAPSGKWMPYGEL